MEVRGFFALTRQRRSAGARLAAGRFAPYGLRAKQAGAWLLIFQGPSDPHPSPPHRGEGIVSYPRSFGV